eukprot:352767-Chlamydomonas_euryale.AAC.2
MVLTLVAFKLSIATANYVPITSRMNLLEWFMIAAFVMVALVALQNYAVFKLYTVAPWYGPCGVCGVERGVCVVAWGEG